MVHGPVASAETPFVNASRRCAIRTGCGWMTHHSCIAAIYWLIHQCGSTKVSSLACFLLDQSEESKSLFEQNMSILEVSSYVEIVGRGKPRNKAVALEFAEYAIERVIHAPSPRSPRPDVERRVAVYVILQRQYWSLESCQFQKIDKVVGAQFHRSFSFASPVSNGQNDGKKEAMCRTILAAGETEMSSILSWCSSASNG